MGAEENVSPELSSPYHLADEIAISLEKKCILDIANNRSSIPNIVATLSDYSCIAYSLDNLREVYKVSMHEDKITGIRYSHKSNNLFYTCSIDGTIKMFDLRRDKGAVREFKDDTEGSDCLKPLTSFDVSCNDGFLCAGTEVFDGDAFLVFWDVRLTKPLGGYWESHTEEITQVCFHPEMENIMASGSTDGLINIFDISHNCENDALLHTLNTESSVDKIRWYPRDSKHYSLSCITHTEDLQLWNIDDGAPFSKFERTDVASAIVGEGTDDTYLVDTHSKSQDELLIIAGSSEGRGEILKSLSVRGNDATELHVTTDFTGNKQVVRASMFHENNNIFVTGGESGILSVWKPGNDISPSEKPNSAKMLSKSKFHVVKLKPYS